MKVISVRMTDAIADALAEQIAKRGQAGQRGAEAALMRELLYKHLNRVGYSATQLSMDDSEYQKSVKIDERQRPARLSAYYEEH